MKLANAITKSQKNAGWKFTSPRWSHDEYALWENDALIHYTQIRSTFRKVIDWYPRPSDIIVEDWIEYEDRFTFAESYALMREGKKMIPLSKRDKPQSYNTFVKGKLRIPLQAEDVDDLWVVVE